MNLNFKAKRTIQKFSKTLLTQFTRVYSIKFDYDLDGYGDAQIEYIKEETVAEYIVDVITETLLEEPNFPEELTQTYIQNTHLYSSTSVIREELVYHDIEGGEVVETRRYTDGFINDNALFSAEENLNTLSITLDSGEQIQVDSERVLFDTSSIAWDAETWSSDNVPIEFDTISTETPGGEDIKSNIHEATITIIIPNRNSLYYDFLKGLAEEKFTDTTFIIKGVLITPHDGKVYISSDKDKFFADSTHKDAKTEGSYLFYDSDLNGFYETVYILSPDDDGDGVYYVMGIGYNYDGSHDFVPYDTMPLSSEEYGTTQTTQSSTITLSDEGSELDIYYKDSLDEQYPQDIFDGIAPKVHIYEISQLVFDREAREIYPALYNDIFKRVRSNSLMSYSNKLWADVANEVGKSTIAGYAAAVVGLTISGWLAPFVFAGLYFVMSLPTGNRARYIEESKVEARTFYQSDDEDWENPPSLNEKQDQIVKREGWREMTNLHTEAYYTTVFGGSGSGEMYEASVITSPPAIWRYAHLDVDLGYSPYPYILVDSPTGPQLVLRTYDLKDTHLGSIRQFTDFNLDYFLITSELPALADTLNNQYSPNNDVFSLELNIGTTNRQDLYQAYKTNTIGYLEQEITYQSEGKFDSIRPIVINGIPQYTFVDSNDNMISKTQPLSPLYSPIIVGQTRYDELKRQGKYKDSVLIIITDCVYGTTNNAFNAYQLHPLEAKKYSAKIPLSPTEFNYPITSITIEVKEQLGGIVKTVDVNAEDYTIDDGNLFFTKALEEIVFEDKAEWQSLSSKKVARRVIRWIDGVRRISTRYVFQTIDLNYNIKISFATVVPYSDSFNLDADPYAAVPSLNIPDFNIFLAGMDYAGYQQTAGLNVDPNANFNVASYGLIGHFDSPIPEDIIDTTSNDQARMILAQTTSYTISDYFNQVQMAREDGPKKIDETEYLITVTFWSTLISSLVLLPAAIATISVRAGISISNAFVASLISIPFAVGTEIMEELYLDPFIENVVSNYVKSLGGDEEAANYWSLFITSFREAFMGGVSQAYKYQGNLNLNIDTKLTLKQPFDKLEQLRKQLEAKKPWKSMINVKSAIGIIAAVSSFFIGAAGLAILAVEFNMATDLVVEKLKNYYLAG
ncbi:hypothetical protein LCGC14_1414080, partial [marine sediment metagenome]